MGGFGSGRHKQQDVKKEVEQCQTISAFLLHKHGILAEGAECHGNIRIGQSSIKFKRERNVLIVAYPISAKRIIQLGLRVSHSKVEFGGQRPWLHCPQCDRRCAKLYLAPEQELYLCRACANLTYRSTRR